MAHCSTIFHHMLKLIPRNHFSKLEREHGTGRPPRTFSRWHQLVHLVFMQVTSRASLRDGVAALKARFSNLYHLGGRPVARSTFADANNRRPASFFEALFGLMNRRCQPLAPKHKFRFKNKLFSLDATVVSLCLSLFPWASFRRTKAGIKLHTLLDHDGYLPAFVAISPAREPDFFRWVKQNLKIKAFIGNSENAVMGQIYAALIVYLLLCYTKFLCNLSVTLQNFMRILQLNLFRSCSLQELFEPPGPVPNNINVNNQLTLDWA